MKRQSAFIKWYEQAHKRMPLRIARYEGNHTKLLKLAFNAGLRSKPQRPIGRGQKSKKPSGGKA